MSATQSAAFDGEDVTCRHCKSLMCIVPRGHITDVQITCRCGANTRIAYSPQGWRDIRVVDKARDAAMKVADAEIRLARAHGAYDRAVADIGRSAGKEFAAGLDAMAPGAGAAAKIGLDLANRTIAYTGQEAAKCCTGLGGPVDIDLTPRVGQGGGVSGSPKSPKRSWWKRVFRV